MYGYIIAISLIYPVISSPPEDRLMRDIKHGYVVEERPVIDSTEPVKVQLGVSLQQIIDVVRSLYNIIYFVLTNIE